MMERDKVVFHSMYQKGWTRNILDLCKVIKPILNEVLEHMPSLVLGYRPDRLKAGHQKESSWLPDTADMSRRTTPHTSTENYDVLLLNAEHLTQVVIDIFSIIKHIVFI